MKTNKILTKQKKTQTTKKKEQNEETKPKLDSFGIVLLIATLGFLVLAVKITFEQGIEKAHLEFMMSLGFFFYYMFRKNKMEEK